MPLLIGGATTSRAHTALKIDPHYKSPTVWVKDASRAVGVAQSLVSQELREPFVAANDADYAEIRDAPPQPRRRQAAGVAGQGARAAFRRRLGELHAAGAEHSPASPCSTTTRSPTSSSCIDWTPFFNAWELAGRYPAILDDAVVGAQARELFADAQAMLRQIVAEKWLTAQGGRSACGRRTASATTSVLGSRWRAPATLHFLRQQVDKPVERPDFCLADFIAPKDSRQAGLDRRLRGHRGHRHRTAHRALRGRPRRLQRRSCSRRWPTAWPKPSPNACTSACARNSGATPPTKSLDDDALIGEKYRGIRPAPGYPACPDHTEKSTLFRLLDADRNAGMELTESFAMYPAAAVSGYYFSHPQSQYFVVGRVSQGTGRRLCAAQGRGRWRRPSGGWRRISITTRNKSQPASAFPMRPAARLHDGKRKPWRRGPRPGISAGFSTAVASSRIHFIATTTIRPRPSRTRRHADPHPDPLQQRPEPAGGHRERRATPSGAPVAGTPAETSRTPARLGETTQLPARPPRRDQPGMGHQYARTAQPGRHTRQRQAARHHRRLRRLPARPACTDAYRPSTSFRESKRRRRRSVTRPGRQAPGTADRRRIVAGRRVRIDLQRDGRREDRLRLRPAPPHRPAGSGRRSARTPSSPALSAFSCSALTCTRLILPP